jgi:hypothetical protein
MIFKDFIKNLNGPTQLVNTDPKNISVYPIGENNLEGIKILIDNCFRMGSDNSNVRMATVDPSLWLGQFLDKHWNKISYVTSMPSFNILKVENNQIVSKNYNCLTKEFESDELINEFFEKGKWKTFVLFSIIKYVDLVNLNTSYRLRYADITEKYEERDNKLEEILK